MTILPISTLLVALVSLCRGGLVWHSAKQIGFEPVAGLYNTPQEQIAHLRLKGEQEGKEVCLIGVGDGVEGNFCIVGDCFQGADGTRACQCKPLFTGDVCDKYIGKCAPDVCIGGTCRDNATSDVGFSCTCQEGDIEAVVDDKKLCVPSIAGRTQVEKLPSDGVTSATADVEKHVVKPASSMSLSQQKESLENIDKMLKDLHKKPEELVQPVPLQHLRRKEEIRRWQENVRAAQALIKDPSVMKKFEGEIQAEEHRRFVAAFPAEERLIQRDDDPRTAEQILGDIKKKLDEDIKKRDSITKGPENKHLRRIIERVSKLEGWKPEQ